MLVKLGGRSQKDGRTTGYHCAGYGVGRPSYVLHAACPKGRDAEDQVQAVPRLLTQLGERGGKSNLLDQVVQPYGVHPSEMLQQLIFSNLSFLQARGMMMNVARES